MTRFDLPFDDQMRLTGIEGCLQTASPEKLNALARRVASPRFQVRPEDLMEIRRAAVALEMIRKYIDEINGTGDPPTARPDPSSIRSESAE